MRINYLIVPLLFFIAGFSFTQDGIKTLTIDEAVEQALNNNAQLKYQNYEIQKADGLITKAGIIPNPVASSYREELYFPGENNLDYNEWTITGSMPFNFLWNRWSAVNSTSSVYDSELKRYEYLKNNLIADVKSAYIKYHFYSEINKSWRNALGIIEHAQQTAQAREEEGEISGYDNQRILLEYLIYKKNETESKLNLQNTLNELSLLLYPTEPHDSIQTEFAQPVADIPVPDFPSLQSLIEKAKKNRADLSAEKFSLESKASSLSNEQLKIIPDVSFSLGYKKQSDELKGLVYGFNLGIPLFNRNQGDIQIAEAELNQQNILVESLSKKIELEVSNAYKKLKEYESQLTAFNKYDFLPSEEIITTAQFSYEEGEMTLVELIDALRAYTDSVRLRYELFLNYYVSLFDLEKTIGKELLQR